MSYKSNKADTILSSISLAGLVLVAIAILTFGAYDCGRASIKTNDCRADCKKRVSQYTHEQMISCFKACDESN